MCDAGWATEKGEGQGGRAFRWVSGISPGYTEPEQMRGRDVEVGGAQASGGRSLRGGRGVVAVVGVAEREGRGWPRAGGRGIRDRRNRWVIVARPRWLRPGDSWSWVVRKVGAMPRVEPWLVWVGPKGRCGQEKVRVKTSL